MTKKLIGELEDLVKLTLDKLPYTESRNLGFKFEALFRELRDQNMNVPALAEETPFVILRKLDEIKGEVLNHQQKITVYPNDLDIVVVPKVVDGAYVINLYHKADDRVRELVEESLQKMLPSPIFTEGTAQVNINLGVKR